jgi:Fungal specific transcription factor domain.
MLKLSQDNPTPAPGSNTDTEREDITCLYLMIAIGAQCRGGNETDLLCAAQYFSQARRMAFEGMLQNPTLNMVRTFILLAFYMFGACRRNAAFMYIGVAAKASIVLGLHTSGQYKNMSTEERDIRSTSPCS